MAKRQHGYFAPCERLAKPASSDARDESVADTTGLEQPVWGGQGHAVGLYTLLIDADIDWCRPATLNRPPGCNSQHCPVPDLRPSIGPKILLYHRPAGMLLRHTGFGGSLRRDTPTLEAKRPVPTDGLGMSVVHSQAWLPTQTPPDITRRYSCSARYQT